MAKQKSNKQKSAKKKQKGKKQPAEAALSGKSFAKLSITAFLGVSLSIVLVSTLFFFLIIVPQATQKTQFQADAYVNTFGNQLDLSIKHLQVSLSGTAKNERTGKFLAANDQEALKQMEMELENSLPYAVSIRLFPSNTAKINRDIFPPISFASLDMIQKAESGIEVSPEVQKIEQRLLLSLVQSVTFEGKPVGVIYTTFNFKNMSSRLSSLDSNVGYLTLSQTFPNGKSQQVLQSGDAKWQNSDYVSSYNNKIGNWKTQFHMAPPMEDTSTFLLFYFIAMLLMVLSAVLFISFGLRSIELALRQDSTILLAISEQIAEKDVRRQRLDYKFNTLLFASIGHTMERFLEEVLVKDPKHLAETPARNPLTKMPDEPTLPQVDSHGEPLYEEESSESVSPTSDAIDSSAIDSSAIDSSTTDDAAVEAPNTVDIPQEIFRAYDIRGIVGKTLSNEIVELIGQSIGSDALSLGQNTIIVARDGRLSGPELSISLIKGITQSGCDVIDLGMVPTPMLYFACNTLESTSGVILTGSHNPADYNGLKIVINGETLSGDRIQSLYQRITENSLISGEGSVTEHDIKPEYFSQVLDDVVLATNIKVVVDCGNGVAGMAAPELLTELGCEVIPLYCDVDGHFPNHHPDPSKPENLAKLIETIKETNADLGLAFDGDGDRLGVVTNKGKIIWADRLMMLFSKDLLVRNPGADIIFDVKCTSNLSTLISKLGGRPMMWKTGHSFIKAKLKETNASLAGEMSGHIFFNDRWFGFDDALYSAARLLEILTTEQGTCDEIFAELPDDVNTPEINIDVPESKKFEIIDELLKNGQFGKGQVTTIDGVRVDYPKAWGLVRASNTTPCLVARFEAQSEEALEQIKALFRKQLLDIDSSLQLPF